MARGKPADERGPVTPKQVFERMDMPSRWERLTAVAPKIFEDKVFLSFVAARYLGEELLPHPATLVAPDELRQQKSAKLIGLRVCAGAGALAVAVGTSAREITEDRKETELLEQSRLRDTPAVRETIASDNALRDAAIARLAARVHAFAAAIADFRQVRLQALVRAHRSMSRAISGLMSR